MKLPARLIHVVDQAGAELADQANRAGVTLDPATVGWVAADLVRYVLALVMESTNDEELSEEACAAVRLAAWYGVVLTAATGDAEAQREVFAIAAPFRGMDDDLGVEA